MHYLNFIFQFKSSVAGFSLIDTQKAVTMLRIKKEVDLSQFKKNGKRRGKRIAMAVVMTVMTTLLAAYLFQKPFTPSPYESYRPQWSNLDLVQLPNEMAKKEKTFPNLKKDCDKKIGLHDKPESTEYAFVYIPGFSATRKEIFPVVESLSKQFAANYFLSRFPAHGEGALDFKKIEAQGLFDTVYEAGEIAPKLGRKKIFIGTSTGAALVAAGLVQNMDIDAAILIAPAFAVYPKNSWLLSTRLGPVFNFFLVDEIYKWSPRNPSMELYWSTSYHRDGLIALLQSVEYIRSLDFSKINKPVLMLYTKNDDVVINQAIIDKFTEIKDKRSRLLSIPASSHVLAGEFTSPETTELAIKEIHSWIQSLDL
ncbi:MAG: alpha/beta hydrolase [Bdellovibrionaceae bacterium]|nr:alpha/beta hydrolase [Pseudobdellovibrionaceae bacterium]